MSSKYEYQIDDNNVICPYCKHEYQPEAEGYSEDTREDECDQCGMKYYLHQCFSVDHCTTPDCELNGQQHKEEIRKLKSGEFTFCSVCDKYIHKKATT